MSNQLEKIISAMDGKVSELMQQWNLPGISVSLIQGGETIFSKDVNISLKPGAGRLIVPRGMHFFDVR